MGFPIDDRKMKWAGLDYWDKLDITYYDSLDDFMEQMDGRLYLISSLQRRSILGELCSRRFALFYVWPRGQRGCLREFMRRHPEKALRIPMNDQHVQQP